MAKGGIGKLGKLKCMIKRWQTSTGAKPHHHMTTKDAVHHHDDDDNHQWKSTSTFLPEPEKVPLGPRTVYVGQSRRRYLISSHLVDHPLFRVLVQRSGGGVSEDDASDVVVGCEVVLFEHLLWMLENADPQPESLDELVDFYAC